MAILLTATVAYAGVTLEVRPDNVSRVQLIEQTDGTYGYMVENDDGTTAVLTPDQFARRLYVDTNARPWYYTPLNITSPAGVAWVAMGLLAQILFTGRMIVQWLVSEKNKQSTVPVAFWWMSLIGATMLVVYFAWRKDIVGILGQSAGWLIYVRNLMMIYRKPAPPPPPEVVA
jgi:lipid-A-disaccharide synthase-like uncharacterized protein